MQTRWLASVAVVLAACPSVDIDENEQITGPTVEFDPANKIVPFPNNLLLDPATGKVALPEQCNETPTAAATRTQVLNKLDGFGTYETAMTVTFTEPVDPASLAGHIVLFQRVRAGDGNDPLTAIPVPVVAIPRKTTRFTNQDDITNCTDPVMVDQVTMIPTAPLEQNSTYTVALLDGITTANGERFVASFTWSLIREPQPVVVFDAAGNVIVNHTPLDPSKAEDKAQLLGIDLLWNAHHAAVTFLAGTGHDSEELLLAWEFNTQTITTPFDPAVSGTPAANISAATPLIGNLNLAVDAPTGPAVIARVGPFAPCATDNPVPNDTQCFLRVLLGGGNPNINVNYAIGKATCAAAGCDNIGTIMSSILLSKQYQQDVTNTGYTGTGATPIPGAWDDPIRPSPAHDTTAPNPLDNDPQAQIGVLVLLPTDPPPANGYPVVIFQHGITRSRGDAFAMAGGLTSQGFAVVAIDAPLHGSRAVRISDAANVVPALDCSDVTGAPLGDRADNGPDPTSQTSCYAPPFSSDLAATRDGFRQTVLDLQQLVTSLEVCGTTACNELEVDIDNIFYVGHSLIGGNIGEIALGVTNIKAGVLSVSGAGWFDILENTGQTAAFQCPLVDALIDAGVLAGDKFDPIANTGLCTTDAWKTDPGYLTFSAIGRWILDPSDPANFAFQLSQRTFLLQEVVDDDVVPNLATENEGKLVDQLRGDASCGIPVGGQVPPSTALLADPTASHFLDYITIAPGTDPDCAIGNTFGHGSLLLPEASVTGGSCALPNPAGCDGFFATVRMQTDAIFFLLSNVE